MMRHELGEVRTRGAVENNGERRAARLRREKNIVIEHYASRKHLS